MKSRWKIAIEAMPAWGNAADKKAAGADDGAHFFYVEATDIRDAMTMAECFAAGIECNPAVWKARIIGVYIERPEG